MIRNMLVVGGASGIGLAIAEVMAERDEVEQVVVVDKSPLAEEYARPRIASFQFDLTENDYSFFDQFEDVDAVIVTAGFGRLGLFRDLPEEHISGSFAVNTVPTMRLVKRFYRRLESEKDFYFGVMVSIAGFMSSPFFSVYGATKAALKIFIESVNVELEKAGSHNRILNVSPGSIKGTGFYEGKTDLGLTAGLAKEIISHLEQKDDLYIPLYEEVFKEVLRRYQQDFREEGRHSYDYKMNSGRMK